MASSPAPAEPRPALNAPTTPPPTTAPLPAAGGPPDPAAQEASQRRLIIGIVVGVIVLIALVAVAVYYLVGHPTQTAAIRDVFIIFMALEFIVIGVALVVLVYQLALITNMLRHEIKPILESTNETVATVRGTTAFLSEHLVDPVIKLNANLAGFANVLDTLGSVFGRRGRK